MTGTTRRLAEFAAGIDYAPPPPPPPPDGVERARMLLGRAGRRGDGRGGRQGGRWRRWWPGTRCRPG